VPPFSISVRSRFSDLFADVSIGIWDATKLFKLSVSILLLNSLGRRSMRLCMCLVIIIVHIELNDFLLVCITTDTN
jgi:hypothetical protein